MTTESRPDEGLNNKAASGETVHLHVEMPREMHRAFSVFCARRGLKLAQVVRDMISEKLGAEMAAGR